MGLSRWLFVAVDVVLVLLLTTTNSNNNSPSNFVFTMTGLDDESVDANFCSSRRKEKARSGHFEP